MRRRGGSSPSSKVLQSDTASPCRGSGRAGSCGAKPKAERKLCSSWTQAPLTLRKLKKREFCHSFGCPQSPKWSETHGKPGSETHFSRFRARKPAPASSQQLWGSKRRASARPRAFSSSKRPRGTVRDGVGPFGTLEKAAQQVERRAPNAQSHEAVHPQAAIGPNYKDKG